MSDAAPQAAGAASAPLAVHMRGICKRFGKLQANDHVELKVRSGSVHGVVGENGAGKSTLMSVLYGFYQADAGEISVYGERAHIRNADDAIALGIGMVHQHFMLVESLSVLDNVLLGAEAHWLLRPAQAQARARLLALMQSTGLQVDLDARIGSLNVGDRQRVEILKALYRGAKILILDEPTAVLTPQETQQLFAVLRQLRSQGTSTILITHKLKEVLALCDDITVMRAARVVLELTAERASLEVLAQAMVGRKVQLGRVAREGAAPGEVLLRAQGLNVRDALGVARLRDVSLAVRAGEIVGIAGVSGNGQSELLDVLSGLLRPDSGTLELGAARFAAENWLQPRGARALGQAHVPEDRHARALVLPFAAWESAVLGYEEQPAHSRWGWMRRGQLRRLTQGLLERFDVRPRNARLRSSQFSGGNQQKLVLARELAQAPRVLLVGQPTRGVDIGAIEFIYGQLRARRDAGCAVLLVSGELDEILALSDRVLVMHQGAIAGELAGADCSEAALGLLMSGAGA